MKKQNRKQCRIWLCLLVCINDHLLSDCEEEGEKARVWEWLEWQMVLNQYTATRPPATLSRGLRRRRCAPLKIALICLTNELTNGQGRKSLFGLKSFLWVFCWWGKFCQLWFGGVPLGRSVIETLALQQSLSEAASWMSDAIVLVVSSKSFHLSFLLNTTAIWRSSCSLIYQILQERIVIICALLYLRFMLIFCCAL